MLPCSAVMLMAVVMLGSGILAALSAAWADKRLIHGRRGGRQDQTVVTLNQTSGRREGGPPLCVAALDESDGGFEEAGSPRAFLRFLYFRDRQEMLAKIFVGFIASVGDALQYLALALLPSEVWSVQQQLRAACICCFLYMLRGVVLGFSKYMFLLNLVISVMFFSLAGAAAGEAGAGEADAKRGTLLVGTCVMILAQVVCALGSILEEVIFKVEVGHEPAPFWVPWHDRRWHDRRIKRLMRCRPRSSHLCPRPTLCPTTLLRHVRALPLLFG